MSRLQLSDTLVDSIQDLLGGHDERARDPGIAIQYLAAVIGYMVGRQEMPAAAKDDVLEQLAAFSQHVMQDVDRERNTAPPSEEAFGIWRAH